MAPVSEYTVHAKRAGKYWELHVDGVGVTQARNLQRDADEMIRHYVSMMTGEKVDTVTYNLLPEVGGSLDSEAAKARAAARDAEAALNISAKLNRKAARDLRAAGLSGRDAATVLGLTPQRVSQLINRS